MNAKTLYAEIIGFCEHRANQDIVKKYDRYFKGGFNGFGLSNDLIKSKVKSYKHQKNITLDLVCQVSQLLVKEEKYELPSFGLLLLHQFSKEFDVETFKQVESWFSIGINNWAHTDGICQYIFPVFWKKEIIKLHDLESWRIADNKFQRRCVPVAMIKLLKYNDNFKEMFLFIDPMMMDPEREVHQGLGWFLRECWKRQPDLTEKFLLKWKDDCARLIIQYATEKIPKEDRLRFRKSKS